MRKTVIRLTRDEAEFLEMLAKDHIARVMTTSTADTEFLAESLLEKLAAA